MTKTPADTEALTDAVIEAVTDTFDEGWQPRHAKDAVKRVLEAAPIIPSPPYGGVKEALEPFAKAAGELTPFRDSLPLTIFTDTLRHLTVRDLRRASAAYDALSPVAVEEADAKAERKGHTLSDDEVDEATIRQRDIAEDAADKLAEAIGELLGVNVGEHSSAHSPWETALEHAGQAIRNRAPSTPSPQIGKAGAGPVGEPVARAPASKSRPLIAENRWHLGAMNDGLFIIDKVPGLTTDAGPWDREDGPKMVLNVVALTHGQAKAIVDAHNSAIAAMIAARPVEEPGEVEREVWQTLDTAPALAFEDSETDPVAVLLCNKEEEPRIGYVLTLRDGTKRGTVHIARGIPWTHWAPLPSRAALTGDAQEAAR